jgi:hypothetical protein
MNPTNKHVDEMNVVAEKTGQIEGDLIILQLLSPGQL